MILQYLYQKMVSVPLKLLVSSKLLPDDPIKELAIELDSPIYYVLQRRSTSSFLMLQEKAKKLNLPEPQIIKGRPTEIPNGAVFFLQNKNIFGFVGKPVKKYQLLLSNLLHTQKQQTNKKHQLIPASIYWGRNPGKENSLLRLFFTDTESATPLRKMFLFIFQGRNSFVRLAKPIDMNDVLASGSSEATSLTKLTRTLRVHFHRHRNASMGPLISNRRQVITNIISSNNVKDMIEREASKKKISVKKANKMAAKYAN